MADEEKVLPKEEALALARQGKDVWNTWAKDNPGVGIDFSGHDFTNENILFSEYVFPSRVDFSRAVFGTADFEDARFIKGDVDFTSAKFTNGDVKFIGAIFTGDNLNFTRAEFFGGDVLFLSSEFKVVLTIFIDAKFSNGDVIFFGSNFTDGDVLFVGAEFVGCDANFRDVTFKDCDVYFDRAKFNGGDTNFSHAVFSGGSVSFNKVKFVGGKVSFYGSQFRESDINFDSAVFDGRHCDFRNVSFDKEVSFWKASFMRQCSFEGAKFAGPINLAGSHFKKAPDFRRSIMSAHFTLHEMKVEYSNNPKNILGIFKQSAFSTDTDKFRRLKELAVQARDHEREQDFFAKELKAKRFYETTGLALGWSYLYEWFSDFGRSSLRPLFWLFVTWLGFGVWFGTKAVNFSTHTYESLRDGVILSGALLTPFVAISRTAIRDMQDSLYGEGVSLWWLDVAAIFEGLLGLIFIFLIGLALRNRFRI